MYETSTLGDDAWTQAGYLNLAKDLSVLNRRGYGSTTNKGVPLIYRVRFTMSQHTLTGRASAQDASDSTGVSAEDTVETAIASDNTTLMKVMAVQNNWVIKNAAVKWHAARAAMWRKAGIKKSELGAYQGAIRYNFDSANQTWLTTYDGDGAAFVGGTWDVSAFADNRDDDYQLKLVGPGVDEDVVTTGSVFSLAHTYMSSRGHVPADSNLESDETPADQSRLRNLLAPLEDTANADDVRADVRDGLDNPPYQAFTTEELNPDLSEPVEAGRVICGPGVAVGTVICDIPFGLAELQARHAGSQNQNIDDPVAFGVEVLDIYEMQG